jgi:hypothetical protein
MKPTKITPQSMNLNVPFRSKELFAVGVGCLLLAAILKSAGR